MTEALDLQARINKLSCHQQRWLAIKLKLDAPKKTRQKLVACIKYKDDAVAVDDIKHYLGEHLPEQFVPQSIFAVDDFPRTAAGKVNRDNLSNYSWNFQALAVNEKHNATNLSPGTDTHSPYDDPFDGYVAPRNNTEHTLAKIWRDVLGAEDLSIHDNFLEVGGDSLLSIRILARANKAGLNIATQDFFEHPTIAEQATLAKKAQQNVVKEGKIEGIYNLTPIQHWFFKNISNEQHHWNQSLLLNVDELLDFLSLERTIQKLLIHHDVLRTVFVPTTATGKCDWQQEIKPFKSELPLHFLDLSATPEYDLNKELESTARVLNSSLQLEQNGLVRFLFVQTEAGLHNRLIIVAHHLIIDAESWRILIQDLTSSWQALANGNQIELPDKTNSFKCWSQHLHQFSGSPKAAEQLYFWQEQLRAKIEPVPVDYSSPAQENIQQFTKLLQCTLNKEDTLALTTSLSKKHTMEVQEKLITALVASIFSWSKNQKLLIDIEGHGRESLFEGVDVSRTVGWFTSVFPVMFDKGNLSHQDLTISTTANMVKQALRAIPDKGIGFGILNELPSNPLLNIQPKAEVCFNYLGQLDKLNLDTEQTSEKNANIPLLTIVDENIGNTRGDRAPRAYLIEVNVMVVNGLLTANFEYSERFHIFSTISVIAESFLANLRQLSAMNGHEAQAIEATQNDLPIFELADLDDDELSAISAILLQADQ